jgi:putative ABC transport system permease protein
MGVISRGIKDAFRNTIRTVSITFILALSIAMSLIMLLALKTVQAKITNVKSSIGNTISISPAGVRGFEGGGTLLTNQNATDVKSLAHVSTVVETLSGRLTTIGAAANSNPFGGGNDTSNSNAQTSLTAPPIQAPSGSGSSGRTFRVNGQDASGGTFSMPITVTGLNDLSNLSVLNASSFSLSSGSKIDPTSSDNVAMLGKELASQNNISVGQTFTAYGQTITVKGIFDAGNTFANAGIVMPIATVQTLSAQAGSIDSMVVTTDSIDSLSSVQTAIKNKLGSTVDVTTSEQSAESAVTPLENIKTISLYSLIGSLVAGSIIIFLTMIMIVRERRREIGVLKAIGSSNMKVMSQFTVEALVLTLLSSVIGMILGFIFSNPVLNVLVTNSESSSTTGGGGAVSRGGGFGGGGGFAGRIAGGFGNAGSALRNIHAVVGYDLILYGLLAAVVIAVIGSAIPSFFIAKIRPAEVMRAE